MQFKKIEVNELLLVVYFFIFELLSIVTHIFKGYSVMIHLLGALSLVGYSLFYNRCKVDIKFIKFLILSLVFWIYQIIFHFNEFTFYYLYYFTIFGILTAYFFSNVSNFGKFLDYLSNVSVVILFIKVIDIVLGFPFSATYMVFGFSLLPAFCGLFVGWYYLQKKPMFFLVIVSFFLIVLFGNRSSILTAFIFIVVNIVDDFNKNKQRVEKESYLGLLLPLFLFLTIIFVFNLNSILSTLYHYLNNNGFHSYSLLTLTRFTDTWDIGIELSGRFVIQENAIEFIKNNNIYTGNGIGSFISYYGRYSHNFILDIINSTGILGFAVFLGIMKKNFSFFTKSNRLGKIFFLFMFLNSFIPLTFSKTFIEIPEFWVLILFGFFFENYNLDEQYMYF